MKKLMLLAVSLLVMGIGCAGSPPPAPTQKQIQSQKAKEAAESINFSENSEIDNIKKRLELTSNPGALGYVVLLNEMGQPIVYTSVVGKVTSSSKRLTSPWQVYDMCRNGVSIDCLTVTDAPSDEGTWGSSSPYVYFWSQTGQYYQWSGQYLYSDKPLRLSVKPLVIDLVE